MAWLSVGTSNEDLCQKMVENEVLHEGTLLEAFRATDRGDFVADEDRYYLLYNFLALFNRIYYVFFSTSDFKHTQIVPLRKVKFTFQHHICM